MDVLMPQLGETVAEGTVAAWHKQVGDRVEADEILLDIETDKVSMEVPAPGAGTLVEIRVEAGETVEVGTVLAVVRGEGEADAPAEPARQGGDVDDGNASGGDPPGSSGKRRGSGTGRGSDERSADGGLGRRDSAQRHAAPVTGRAPSRRRAQHRRRVGARLRPQRPDHAP